MNAKKQVLLGIAITTLATGALACSSAKVTGDQAKGECHGVNACKGKGECGGPGYECAGNNACKGQGWLSLTQKDCLAKNGTYKAK